MQGTISEKLNNASFILFLVSFVPYIWAIVVTGHGKPSPVSWIIWASVDTLTLLALLRAKKKGRDIPLGQIKGAVTGAWIIAILAIIYGKPNIGAIEWVTFVIALSGIILWTATENETYGLICSQIALFVAAFPTFAKGYTEPASEDPLAWSICLASCICALLAIREWKLATALQPITFTIVEATMVILVVIRPQM
ncbi:MAG: hypothetical protein V4473_00100 [Patescibacteria group bacterium]